MITHKEREGLYKKFYNKGGLPENGIGWDCDGQVIRTGDTVEVVTEEDLRKGKPEYSFCSIGRRGKAIGTLGGVSWTIRVKFSDGQTVGCADIHTRKV